LCKCLPHTRMVTAWPSYGNNYLDSTTLRTENGACPVIPGKVVNLLEILRAYAEAYVKGTHALGLLSTAIAEEQKEQHDIRQNVLLLQRLQSHLTDLFGHCEHLPMTAKSIQELLAVLIKPESMSLFTQTEMVLLSSIADIQKRLRDELSINLFFKLPSEKKRYFDSPREGWEESLSRFPDAILDVEEMSKCFALSRYAACVFHSVGAIEVGLLHLGRFLSVNDPKSGWTAVSSKLQKIVGTDYQKLTQSEKDHFAFVEQMHAVTQALKSAWRNKISHAQGKLTVMTSEFSPDVAEEIMMASRSFMRRLAMEMPS